MQRKITQKQPNSKLCFVCGLANHAGLKARFYGLDDDQLLGLFSPGQQHQGYPGRLHGGIAAAILDEAIGRAINVNCKKDIWGVTVDFSMKLRKPIPLDRELRVVCRIINQTGRKFEGAGEIILEDGSVAVEAWGKYLKMDIKQIADFNHRGEQWFVESMANDPKEVEI